MSREGEEKFYRERKLRGQGREGEETFYSKREGRRGKGRGQGRKREGFTGREKGEERFYFSHVLP